MSLSVAFSRYTSLLDEARRPRAVALPHFVRAPARHLRARSIPREENRGTIRNDVDTERETLSILPASYPSGDLQRSIVIKNRARANYEIDEFARRMSKRTRANGDTISGNRRRRVATHVRVAARSNTSVQLRGWGTISPTGGASASRDILRDVVLRGRTSDRHRRAALAYTPVPSPCPRATWRRLRRNAADCRFPKRAFRNRRSLITRPVYFQRLATRFIHTNYFFPERNYPRSPRRRVAARSGARNRR